MDTKILIKALKVAVREVIKEELTEILREGLESTINEIAQPKKQNKVDTHKTVQPESLKKPKVAFSENKWASILNETDAIVDQQTSYSELMKEGMDELKFSSADAQGFGMMRQNMQSSNQSAKVMEDPETGKVYEVPTEVQQALTRDYSALMKAINKKKGS
jgi:hypothetical protein